MSRFEGSPGEVAWWPPIRACPEPHLRIGTLIILVAVAAAIVIPDLTAAEDPPPNRRSPRWPVAWDGTAGEDGGSKESGLHPICAGALPRSGKGRSLGKLDLVLVGGGQVLPNLPPSALSGRPPLVQDIADYLGVSKAYEAAGLTPAQAAEVDRASRFRYRSSSQPLREPPKQHRCSGWCSCS